MVEGDLYPGLELDVPLIEVLVKTDCTTAKCGNGGNTLPVGFKFKDYEIGAQKALEKGLSFELTGKSDKGKRLFDLGLSGAGKTWNGTVAVVDGNKLKATLASKSVSFATKGYQITGKIGWEIEVTVIYKPKGPRLPAIDAEEVARAWALTTVMVLIVIGAVIASPVLTSAPKINAPDSKGKMLKKKDYETKFA